MPTAPSTAGSTDRVGWLSFLATLLLAEQVASKAVRDALFLVSFDPRGLPPVMIAGGVVSIVGVLVVGRAHVRRRPEVVLSYALLFSAALFGVETVLSWTHPRAAAVSLYLHVSGLGALLVSSFWTVVSTRWDPHTAKRHVARLAAFAALGGVIGGLLAQASSWLGGSRTLLPLLALASLATAVIVRRARPAADGAPADDETSPSAPEPIAGTGLGAIAHSGYLRGLAALAGVVAMWEALLDFSFKAAAHDMFGDEQALVRFFGLFYMGTSLATFAVQAALGRLALRRAGVAATAAATPIVVTLGAVALLGTGFPLFVAMQAGERLLANSLLRSAYAVYFSPIPTQVMRATKTLVDVAATRVGDLLGSLLVLGLVLLGAGSAVPLVVAAGLGLVGLLLLPLITRGYVSALTALVARGVVPDGEPDSLDRTTRLALLGAPRDVTAIAATDDTVTCSESAPTPRLARRAAALESADRNEVRRALERPLEPALVRIALPLLANADLRPLACRALRGAAERATGALLDALVDPETDPAVRGRIPSLLRGASHHRAVPGLLAGLDDELLEVRLQCARGLAHLAATAQGVELDRERILRAIQREIDDNGAGWANGGPDVDEVEDEAIPLDELLRAQVTRSLRCALILVSLTIDPRELELALSGLSSDDASVRGTAFELLVNVLPDGIREPLLVGLDPERRIDLLPRPAPIVDAWAGPSRTTA